MGVRLKKVKLDRVINEIHLVRADMRRDRIKSDTISDWYDRLTTIENNLHAAKL